MYVMLFGKFGDVEIRILLTTLSISAFSMTSLGCAVAEEKQTARYLSIPGLVASGVGLVFFVLGIWTDWFEADPFSKAMAIVAILAFSFAQASLLSLARMPRPGETVFFVAVGFILLLAIVVSVMIILEAHDEWLFRMVGVIGIADGCLSLVVPIMYKLNTRDNMVACPKCGHRFET